MLTLTVNGVKHEVDVDPEMPLAWVLRDRLGLTGTHVSCAIGLCGACTVLLDEHSARSCSIPAGAVQGRAITTIEGLGSAGLHAVQEAWIAEDVVQCGYCQSGFIMATVAFLRTHPHPSDSDIDAELTNICRCGTYVRVRKAVHRAATKLRDEASRRQTGHAAEK